MGREQAPLSSATAPMLHRRRSRPRRPASLRSFRPLTDVTVVDVIAAVRQLPDKQCTSDPLPTRLLKDNAVSC